MQIKTNLHCLQVNLLYVYAFLRQNRSVLSNGFVFALIYLHICVFYGYGYMTTGKYNCGCKQRIAQYRYAGKQKYQRRQHRQNSGLKNRQFAANKPSEQIQCEQNSVTYQVHR